MSSPEYYLKLYTDIHSKFNGVLDLVDHLNENFPKMADNHRDMEDQKVQQYVVELKKRNEKVHDEATSMLKRFESGGGYDLASMSPDGLTAFIKLIDHKAIHQHSQIFVREMSLAYIITTFEEFLKETLRTAFSLDPKTKNEWKALGDEEKEKKLFYLIKLDLKELAVEIRQQFDLDLKKETDWKDFSEYFYRRHILIHNRGIPNKTYRDRTGYAGKDIKMNVDNNYLKKCVIVFKKYSELIEEYFIQRHLDMVNTTKKSNIVHIDLIKDGGKIFIP